VNAGIIHQFLTRVLKERACGYRHMSAVFIESSEREALWIQAYISSL
jgi:hypothetical protein